MQHIFSVGVDIFRLSVWLVILAIVFVPLERLCARNKQQIFRSEFAIDVGYYFMNNFVPKLLLVVPISIVDWCVRHLEPSWMYSWAGALAVPERLLLAIVIGEIGAYWGHRWSHEIPWLWRFHAIHHSAEQLDWLVNTRAHPVDTFFVRLAGLIPIYMLGLAQPIGNVGDIIIIYTLVGTIWSFFVHANVSWRFGFLEQLVATPAFHHWHHTNDGDRYINKNYAAIFPWIDKLFGTLYLPKHRWPQKYGIEMSIASSLIEQLLQPLDRDVNCDRGDRI
jgi:sterol desaturase/sphingolipid hydroxylase (fatty acid hydroxylase superfamily)